jgi:hypothetical protein
MGIWEVSGLASSGVSKDLSQWMRVRFWGVPRKRIQRQILLSVKYPHRYPSRPRREPLAKCSKESQNPKIRSQPRNRSNFRFPARIHLAGPTRPLQSPPGNFLMTSGRQKQYSEIFQRATRLRSSQGPFSILGSRLFPSLMRD